MNKFIFPTVLIILSIGLFTMYIDPTYKEVKELKSVNNQYQEALNKSKELRVIRDSLLESYNSFTEADLSRIKKLLPDNVDNVRLIMDVNSMASTYGAIIRDVKVSSSEESSDVRVNIADIKAAIVELEMFNLMNKPEEIAKRTEVLENPPQFDMEFIDE